MASEDQVDTQVSAPEVSAPEVSAPEEGKKRGRRAARAEKKMQREDRKRRDRQPAVRTSALISMVTESTPSREELEREAAIEFNQALAPSMDLLRAAVPDASSPEEAWRAIESKLGTPLSDPEPELPIHPVYQGDALVYQQLRRHYGRTSPAGSFRRGWSPNEGGSMPPILGGG